MRKAVSILGDKEYITNITQKYVFFRFSDGNQDRLKINESELKELYDWVISERKFYGRMSDELSMSYNKQRKLLEQKHYYTQEEIQTACKKHRFANIDMEIRNKEYMKESYKISGINAEIEKINNKYWKYINLTRQIQAALKHL